MSKPLSQGNRTSLLDLANKAGKEGRRISDKMPSYSLTLLMRLNKPRFILFYEERNLEGVNISWLYVYCRKKLTSLLSSLVYSDSEPSSAYSSISNELRPLDLGASRGREASVGGVGEEQAEVFGVAVGATPSASVLGVRGVPALGVLDRKLVSMGSLAIGKENGGSRESHSPWRKSGPGAPCSSSACRCWRTGKCGWNRSSGWRRSWQPSRHHLSIIICVDVMQSKAYRENFMVGVFGWTESFRPTV